MAKAKLVPAEFVRYIQLLIFAKPFWDSDAGYEALLEGRRLAAEEPAPQPLHALEAQADACVTHDVFDELHRVACRTLVIGGKNDIFTPRWMAEEIAAAFRAATFICTTTPATPSTGSALTTSILGSSSGFSNASTAWPGILQRAYRRRRPC